MSIRRWALAAMALGALCLLPPSRSEGVEVTPAFLVKEISAGVNDVLKLQFKGTQAFEKVGLEPVDFWIDRKGQFVFGDIKEKRKYSAREWCKLRSNEISVAQGREVVLDVPVLAPGGTPPGEFYLGLRVVDRGRNRVAQPGAEVQIEATGLVLIVLRVKGANPKVAAEVIDPSVILQGAIPDIGGTLHNLSTVAVGARMACIVRDTENKVVDRFPLFGANGAPDGHVFLLPETLRDFKGQGNRRLPRGKYVAELFGLYGKKNIRTVRMVPFEVQESDAKPVPPLDDVLVSPSPFIVELPPGGIQYPIFEFKNRGFNPVEVRFSSETTGLGFFPATSRLEPGRTSKVKMALRAPPGENPRRDIMIRYSLEEGSEKPAFREFKVSVYAPGTAPKPDPTAAPAAPAGASTPLPPELLGEDPTKKP